MINQAIDVFTSPLTVTRSTVAVEFVGGIAQPVTTTDVYEVIPISVQPVAARERQLLPELIRDKEVLKAYTKCELRTTDVEQKKLADRVEYLEQHYVVNAVEDWSQHGGFWKATLVKEDD